MTKKKRDIIEELHTKLQHHLDEQAKNWKSFIYAQEKGFYQGFEEIEIDGWRPTEKRFNGSLFNPGASPPSSSGPTQTSQPSRFSPLKSGCHESPHELNIIAKTANTNK